MQNVNGTIRAEMARRQVTQMRLTQALDLPQGAVSARLNGRTDWRLRELVVVAEALHVDLVDLLRAPIPAAVAP